jgi:hypothetical protein
MRRLAALLSALLLCAACSEPPQKEIDRAQGAIDAARAAGAERYAATEFNAATTSLQQAHDAVTQGDYRTALSRALTASERAQEAARQAADGKARARADAEVSLTAANAALQQLHTSIKAAEPRVPAAQLASARASAKRIEGVLQEARAHIGGERYVEAAAALKNVIPTVNEQIRALTDNASKPRPPRKRR